MLSFLRCFCPWMDTHPTNSPVDTFLNAEAIVADGIPCQGRGKIRLFGSYWPAITETKWTIPVGTRVIVQRREGIALVVRPLSVSTPQVINLVPMKSQPGLKSVA